jgi:hypothetical protein
MNKINLEVNSSYYAGTVVEVAPSRVILDLADQSEVNQGNGRGDLKVSVGTYLIIDCESYGLVGRAIQVQLNPKSSTLEATVELFSTILFDDNRIVSGVVNPARVGDKVATPPAHLIKRVITGESTLISNSQEEEGLKLKLATLRSSENIDIHVSPERLFGRHCAILGSTGGGKSWSLARIVEQVGQLRSKVILIDATGEYEELTGATVHVHFGKDTNINKFSERVSVPYHHLNEQDLFAIFRPSGQSQGPKLRAALRSLKLAQLASTVTVDGTILKVHKSKHEFEKNLRKYREAIEAPYAYFDIKLLPQQIENECVEQQRSVTEPDIWGSTSSIDLSNCMSMISRIQDMISSPYLEPVFKPGKYPSIFEKLHNFIRSEDARIFRINMRNLSFAFGTRKVIANAIGRHLFELAQLGCFAKKPIVTVIDEAHQFLTHEGSIEDDLNMDTFGLLAKEGRKYSITLCIATQRPRDIPESVLSQMGTLLVHRLINDNDRGIIERASGEIDAGSLKLIPSLAPGEAILAGVDFPLPLYIRMTPPECRPHSAGADYQRFWS